MKFPHYAAAALLALSPLVFVHPVRVSGDSMAPALKDGQVALALRPWCSGKPALGEIRLFNGPEGRAIKRVLALPGQALELRNGYLTRGGGYVDEPYVSHRDLSMGGPWQAGGGYLLLGDNRPVSRDCRLWGPVRAGDMGGRVLFH